MCSSLIDNNNADEFKNENLLTNRPQRVHVLVEDEEDIRFWKDLLEFSAPEKEYEINAFQTSSTGDVSLTKGKDHLLRDISRYGKTYIACVDSDYDYLLSGTSRYSNALQSTYVIQTQVYSIENYVCEPSTLCDVCYCTSNCISSYDFVSFCNQLSLILYPLLLWSLYFESKGIENEFKTGSDWYNVLPSSVGKDMKPEQELLNDVRRLVDEKIRQFDQKYMGAKPEIDQMESVFQTQFGLFPNGTLQYIQGHALFQYVLNVLVFPEHKSLRATHINQIRHASASSPTQITNLVNHYNNTCRDCKSSLKDNFRYKTVNSHVTAIKSKVRAAVI